MSVVSPQPRIPGAVSGYEARWERHNSERQLTILRAAVELLEESPAGADVAVHRIAKRAGVAKSVVYRQFSGREELDRRIRSYLIDDFAAQLDEQLDVSTGSVREILTRTIRAVADWMSDHPRLTEFARTGPPYGGEDTVDAVASLKLRIAARGSELISSIAQLMGTDATPFDSVPFAVVTMVEGVLSTWVADPAPDRSRAQVVDELATITWFVLDGAARTSGIHVDPDRELTSVLREFTAAGSAGS
ncbi:TetR/AcrR family transcriptional regulator [Nocardia cyriacigeorgica]|uniref:TetR/AcrR family transcriptional regulator n=2 Tax=Nocardia cyriacigeorgica TaxID=135487 RepID=A0A6P1D4A4_9NOCA|nr:TetR/AcrR family transcriptional regulator [Nocardia cyriacigeorgica]NEW41015.1 TetR/AcrR family transcriptional regulator [Nocardia cyriacigeorgica]NEW44281.1 TetR/AcrR family transcriptional regulator [Nocardia cyriacigeorgica]NEW51180.1 TetR/AcrR family transcriptional regulator [Nocardia cyriacigeorgica]NEW55251.1 TetR/AcrR family transcriptional regulator [Nocardia cyriacigeorgica]